MTVAPSSRTRSLVGGAGIALACTFVRFVVGCGAPASSSRQHDASVMSSGDAGDASPADSSSVTDTGASDAGPADCGVPSSFAWSSTGPILGPISDVTHDLVAIKDPSVVYFNGKWHVFVSTVDSHGTYSIAYLTFTDWSNTAAAAITYLDNNPPGLMGYVAAPQVFYFAPQSKWYLVFQSGPPQYSTNDDVGNAAGWTQPASFFSAEPAVVTQNKGDAGGGWLDFWVICDDANCYLFFSDDNGTFYRSQTPVGSFPSGFGNTVVVMQDANPGRLFEASNVYRMKGTGQYLALIEAYDATSAGHRYFRSWTANALDGTWTPLQGTFSSPFASTRNVTFPGGRWTADISHGEMIRDGYDQTLTIDTCQLQYLYQGYDPSEAGVPYNSIPWRLGLLTKTN